MTKVHPNLKWNRRILVVDDERSIADSYEDILCPAESVVSLGSSRSSRSKSPIENTLPGAIEFKFEVDVAYSAEEALEKIKQSIVDGKPYSMGFFDVKLGGGMDGVELVKEAFHLCPDMFAVFVTAHTDRSIENIQSVVGVENVDHWDYLSKPFSHSEILQKARNFTTLWNLAREQQVHEEQLQVMRNKMMDNEIASSVAAVARGVGHEFGNILMQIIGKAELSLNKNEEGLREAMDKVLDASQRAIEILDRFKDLTESGSASVEKSDFNLSDMVQGVQELMEHQIKVSGIKVKMDIPKGMMVHANQTSLMQVIVNLIINAIHASGGEGAVDITAEKTGDVSFIKVRDYGPGVDENHTASSATTAAARTITTIFTATTTSTTIYV